MTTCSQCQAEVAPDKVFLSAAGPVCNRCHFAAESREADARARAAGSGYGESDSPAKMMLKGGAVFGLGVAWLVAGLVFADRLYFYPIFLLLPGFGMFARGLHLQRGR